MDPGVAWILECFLLVGSLSYRQPSGVSFSGCTMSCRGQVERTLPWWGSPWSGLCLPNDVNILMTSVTSVQTRIVLPRTDAKCVHAWIFLKQRAQATIKQLIVSEFYFDNQNVLWPLCSAWLTHRPWIPEEADRAECPWPPPEFGGYDVQSAGLAA